MAVLFLIACLTVVAVSGQIGVLTSGYHYVYGSKPDPNKEGNFASRVNPKSPVPAADVAVPSRPDLSDEDYEDYEWDFYPLENNKDSLDGYVSDNWLLGEENPYYYYSEAEGNNKQEDDEKADMKESPSKHRRKYRKLRSLANKRKRDLNNNFNSFHEAQPARKTSQFAFNRLRRSIKLRTPNFLTNVEKVHPINDLQFIPAVQKREVQFKIADLAAPAGRFQKHPLSKRNVNRRRRQVKAHQLEYFTDNDGDSQFHAPGKAEGIEWDLVPLEALKDDNEEELGIQYDKKNNEASLLVSD